MEAEFQRRTLFAIICGLALAGVAAIVWSVREILLVVFGGVLGGVALSTSASWIEAKLRCRRTVALSAVLTSMVVAITLTIWTRGSALAHQLTELQLKLPAALHQVSATLSVTTWGQWVLAHLLVPSHLVNGINYALPRLGLLVAGTASVIVAIVVVVMVSLYTAAEPQAYLRVLHLLTPSEYQDRVDQCLFAGIKMLRLWLVAKAFAMLAIGLLIYIGLLILRVPLPATLALISALFTFIPNLGPILSALPAAALGFAISPTRGIFTIVLFCVAHFLEGNLVTPLLERRIVTLPPALTLLFQLVLTAVAGPLGLVVAAPLLAGSIGVLQQYRSVPSRLTMERPVLYPENHASASVR